MNIDPDEKEIRGAWIVSGNRVEPDDNVKRIELLLRDHLEEVARDASGWDVLYVDRRDGRYWELLYLESHRHGGGPPTLRLVAPEDARRKYGLTS